ncbi:MAG: flavin reductase [Bacteroidales bacterium]|nr:flavin reductase [Bacteroidales bacterium]
MKSFGSKPWMLPQPVLIIGTYDANGVANAMNAAWGGTWDMHEIVISMGVHATTDNLKLNNGEFTVAFATSDTMIASDFVGIVSAKNEPKKIEKTGWKSEKAPNVNAPLFKDFPMTMECRIKQRLDESETGFYLIAEVVNILCDEKYLNAEGNPDVEKMGLIAYEPVNHKYMEFGKVVGDAFACGKALK